MCVDAELWGWGGGELWLCQHRVFFHPEVVPEASVARLLKHRIPGRRWIRASLQKNKLIRIPAAAGTLASLAFS